MSHLRMVNGGSVSGGEETPPEHSGGGGCCGEPDEALIRVMRAVIERLEFVLTHCMVQNPANGPAMVGTADVRLIEMARWRLESYEKGGDE